MHSYAQTNIQLFNQLRRAGYSNADQDIVRDAYELAMVLFTGRFQASGKPFIAHVVGTASILAALRLPAQVVAAGLLHNVYNAGDFGHSRSGISKAKRREIRRVLSPAVEEYVASFPRLYWESPTIQLARDNPDQLASVDRTVLLILLADHLEHLLDDDVLYYANAVGRRVIDKSKIAAEIAAKLGVIALAAELEKAIRQVEFAGPAVEFSADKARNTAFVIAPKSCHKRVSISVCQPPVHIARLFHSKIQKASRPFYRKLTRLVKAPLRACRRCGIGRKASSKPLSESLRANSEAFRNLFPRDAVLERVATGFQFTEGPIWIAEERSLLFSDIPANRIFKLQANGRLRTFRKLSGNSNGLTRDKQGRLIACEHSKRRVTRTEKDGSITVLADQFQGRRLNSPNDVIVKSDGAIYFTDPPYGISPVEQEQPLQGVYRFSPDAKELSMVAGDLQGPNGLAFSPDEKKLYIDDSKRRHIRVFDVEHDGTLSGSAVFYDLNVTIPGSPDGMKLDAEGRIYCTGPGGVWVFDADGKHLGTILTPEKPSNCAWGDDDWRGLYVTAVTSVYKIRVNIPGVKV